MGRKKLQYTQRLSNMGRGMILPPLVKDGVVDGLFDGSNGIDGNIVYLKAGLNVVQS